MGRRRLTEKVSGFRHFSRKVSSVSVKRSKMGRSSLSNLEQLMFQQSASPPVKARQVSLEKVQLLSSQEGRSASAVSESRVAI
jgi:hypothetical protein